MAPVSIPQALEAFAKGFSFTRGFTHPYQASRVGRAWVLRDAPRRSGVYRNEEWIAAGLAPTALHRIIRRRSRGRYVVSVIAADERESVTIREGFKALGYRLITTEAFFAHALRGIPAFAPPRGLRVERVTTLAVANRLNRAARVRQVLPAHLGPNPPLRQYVALAGAKPVGWVRSIVAGPATWVSNMYVASAWRQRGIAKAMMARMLADDRKTGAKSSVLSSSHAGNRLYEAMGYARLGTLLMFMLPRR